VKLRRPQPKQPTSKELTDDCLAILRRKFYTGDDKCFWQDRRLLLKWVVLYPAAWLNEKGVTIHGDAYREIFSKVFLQAAAHMESKVKFRPAYLRQVIQSHLRIHGEDYYEAAKSARTLADHALMVAGQMRQAAPDPVRDLANAREILTVKRAKKKGVQGAVNGQLNLLA
jgi:hypothetical protein